MTVNCDYKDKCTSSDTFKCNTCRHNKGKRDYYDPDTYKPWPYEPYRPYKPWVISYCTPRFE